MDRRVVTLFDVVRTIQEHSQSDREAVAVLRHLLRTKRVRYAPGRQTQS
jgi:hypothetical protein